MALTQTLTSVSAATATNVFTATADQVVHLRIVNNGSTAGTFNLSISTTTATQQASGLIVPDGYQIAAKTALEITGIAMNTTNEFLVITSTVAVNTIASATSI